MHNRRKLLLSALGFGVAAGGYGLFTADHSLPATDLAAEERFRKLQDALLARYEVPAVSRFFNIPDPPLRVQVIEAGEGDPVLFVHGGNSVAASWVPLLAKLQHRFHIYAPDRPGCGLTTKFNYVGVDIGPHAVAYLGGVMDALGLPRAAIVGNSMGGYFSLVFALAHPERVSKLVLIGEPAGAAPKLPFSYRLIGTRVVNSALFETVLKPKPGSVRSVFQRLVADVNRVPADYLECMDAAAMIPGAVESWITMVERIYPLPGAGILNGAVQLHYKLWPELAQLNVPTLFLWGDKDLDPPSLGEEMAQRMPDAHCEAVADAGHILWLDKLDLCADRVNSFLS
jgi:pimeloyl-ACP methyl ester carboxylesterase